MHYSDRWEDSYLSIWAEPCDSDGQRNYTQLDLEYIQIKKKAA